MIVELDAGNSRIKWRALDDSGVRLAGGSESAADALAAIELQVGIPARVRVSCVRSSEYREALQQEFAQRWGVLAQFAVSLPAVGAVRNAYAEPSLLGVDRWLSMLASYARCHKTCCIVDAGSALTIDFVAADGLHEGGYIVPGLTMQRASLLEGTAIQLIGPGQWAETDPGKSTVAAIDHGIVAMVVQWIASEYSVRGGAGEMFLTGGDAQALSAHLRARGLHHHLVPELVLDGLALALP